MNAKEYLAKFRGSNVNDNGQVAISNGPQFACKPCRATREQIDSLLVHDQVQDLKAHEERKGEQKW